MRQEPDEVKYAGFGMRMLASVIDSLFSLVLIIPVFYVIDGALGIAEHRRELEMAMQNGLLDQAQFAQMMRQQFISFILQNALIAVAVVIFWIYFAATPGKMLLKMKIVNAADLSHPTKGQLVKRYFGYFVSFIPLGLGFIWIYYDRKKQGWHDKIAGTAVIYRQEEV